MQSICKLARANVDGLAVYLVGPAGIISEHLNNTGDVHIPRNLEGLSVIPSI